MQSKVPEITVWFWIIKVLCTTVGESFADWINMTLGVGLAATALIFTIALGVVLAWQLYLDRYVPVVYWLVVVVISVTGTLYTDILTDGLGVQLAVSTTVFAAVLTVVFGVWYARERTLSIHSINTTPRELFYWVAVLVTFALGTAVGDWTLELTGWGPGTSVLLPAGLIVAIVIGWRLGANAVLSFWLAYILTRPLGANIGDWLGFPREQQGLGLGVGLTSVMFLVAISATVILLSVTRADVIRESVAEKPELEGNPARERIMLGYYVVVAIACGALLVWTAGRPHAASAETDSEAAPSVTATLPAGQSATAEFPPAEVVKFRTITHDTLVMVQAGDQAGAKTRITDLETAWDHDQSTLKSLDDTGWTVVDGQIDDVLSSLRASNPDAATETQALTTLLATLK
ncbi:COG4705 family protein [Mycolicibacterium helvum]|uniref:Membrane-anchored protein n=1 Tax=Mycolicibacterium helvum TaxID=1534349 RepID=A0A7I7TH81_9MYCO|nr:hypothetical protein MHEL_59720 [Mycolicibacterium helvum]